MRTYVAGAGRSTVWQVVLRNANLYPDKVAYVEVDGDRKRHELT